MRVLIVDTDPERETQVLEVASREVAERLVQQKSVHHESAEVLAKGVAWRSYFEPGKARTIVILEVP